jgi:hypothetical protein
MEGGAEVSLDHSQIWHGPQPDKGTGHFQTNRLLNVEKDHILEAVATVQSLSQFVVLFMLA